MKNFITLISTLLILTSSLIASTVPGHKEVVGNEEVEVYIANENEDFQSFVYSGESQNFEINSKSEISFIQIMSEDGIIKFQLPVGAKNVTINKNLFETGQNKLGFVYKNKEEMEFAQVQIN